MLNTHSRVLTQMWRANTDFKLILDHGPIVDYILKYTHKAEPQSNFFKQAVIETISKTNDESELRKLLCKLMIAAIDKRDYSHQEITMYNIHMPVIEHRLLLNGKYVTFNFINISLSQTLWVE